MPAPSAGLPAHIATLPEQLRLSLTGDRVHEMAEHKQFTVDNRRARLLLRPQSCEPKSPRQRGTEEDLNALLGQYFPKGTSLRPYSQQDLNEVAAKLNTRPRERLRLPNSRPEVRRAVALTPLSPPHLAAQSFGTARTGRTPLRVERTLPGAWCSTLRVELQLSSPHLRPRALLDFL